jgi:tetratricopeptide (TPR) repeat protein
VKSGPVTQQVEARKKEEILKSLGKGVTDLRQRLGESLASVERFDVPLEQATTASLDAFKFYSLGRKKLVAGDWAEGVRHYTRALQLDPQFASAYDDLAWCYASLREQDLAAEAARKAYSLRDKVSEYERLSISAIYHTLASGDINKAIESLEMMRELFPRSAPVHNTLGGRYASVGRFEEAIAAYQEAIRLNQHPNAYSGLATTLLGLNRLADAKKTIAQARSYGIDNQDLRSARYLIAFHEGDRGAMKEEAGGVRDSADEFQMRGLQAAAAAFQGRLQEFRLYNRQAVDAARRSGMAQAALQLAAEGARTEALLGNANLALQQVKSLDAAGSWPDLLRNSITMLLCGEIGSAEALVGDQERRYAGIDQVRTANVPALRAVIEMERGNGAKALQLWQALKAEQSSIPNWLVYMFGDTLLRHGAAREAEAAFVKVLNRRRVDQLAPFQPLAHLGIARAARLAGDTAKSRKAYEEFFAIWKSADPDLPILRHARAEYSKLEPEPRPD